MFRLFIILCLMTIYWLANAFSGEGTVEKLIQDDFDNNKSKEVFMIETKDGTFELKVSDHLKKTLESGDSLRFEGLITDGRLQPIIIYKHTKPVRNKLNGDRKVLAMIVDYDDHKASDEVSVKSVRDLMYLSEKSVKNNFLLSSFGIARFIDDENSIVVLHIPKIHGDSCKASEIANEALEQAKTQGVDLSPYQHQMFILPKSLKCGWAGLGTVGCGKTCKTWIKGKYPLVYAHELGHNLGLGHSAVDSNNDGTIESEYGDHSGIMGNGGYRLINAPHRLYMEWYTDLPDIVKEIKGGERKDLTSLELDPSQGNVKAHILRVTKSTMDHEYLLSYRTNTGVFGMGKKYANKMSVYRWEGKRKSFWLGAYGEGESFYDAYNGIRVKVSRAYEQSAVIRMYSKNKCGFSKFPCTIHNDTALGDLDGTSNFVKFDVPEGTQELNFEIFETAETSETFAKIAFGTLPSDGNWLCKTSSKSPNRCSVMAPDAGTWYIKLTSKSEHKGINLLVNHE